jgi:hypothetical protein
MRTLSTPESVLKGEITKLGIIECIVAVAVYVAIALRLQTMRYFYLAIAVAPLTLLRTEASVMWAQRAYRTMSDKSEQLFGDKPAPDRPILNIGYIVLSYTFFPIIVSAVRVAGTFLALVRQPVRTIAEMPQNWMRQALYMDFAHPPESLSGVYPGWRTVFFDAKGFNVVFFPAAVLIILPPLLYRISFKATAVCYMPFLWVAQATAGSTLPLKPRLERVTKGELEKVRRWFALFVLGIVGVAAALHFHR